VRGVLLKNFWYAVADAAAVGRAPVKVRALGQDLAVFRRASDGRVVALGDVCVHRMGSLAAGAVDGDCLRCPYHGWAYAGDGACVDIPANPPGTPVPRKARVDSYPAEERHGWVWVFLGDLPAAERPPLPELPELGQPGWRAVRGEFTWRAHFTRVVENAVDVAHTPFVHRATFGDPDRPVMPRYEVVAGPHAVEATVRLPAPGRGVAGWMGGGGENEVRAAIFGASVNLLDSRLAGGRRMILLLAHLPVDERTTLTRFVQLRDFFTSPLADGLARRLSLRVLAEDRPTVESQAPPCVPLAPGADLSTRSDALSLAYRERLRGYVARGWQIDAAARARAFADGRLLVIPSPPRRDADLARAWVLDEVPAVATPDA
jgi:phenylpropionate dioxygenase-like ring-hydroxylating dioxygenase large terminal subunit